MDYALAMYSDLVSANGRIKVSDAAPLPIKRLPVVYDELGQALVVKRAFLDLATSATDSVVVAGVANKSVRVIGATLHGGPVLFTSKPDGAGIPISALMQGLLPPSRFGWLETYRDEALAVTTGAAAGVHLLYVEPSGIIAPLVSPNQINGIRLWLKADAIAGLNDNDPLSSWLDSSGVSGPAVQAVGGLQPIYKINIINGKPVVRFSGGQALRVANVSIGAFTIFTVFRASANGMVYEHSPNVNTGAQSGTFLYTDVNSTISTVRGGQSSSKNLSTNWASDNSWRVVRHAYGGSHVLHRLFVNNVEQALSTSASQDGGLATITDEFNIGSRDESSIFFTGDLPELLVYDGIPSASDIAFLESYLNAKYGVG